jgi:sec-independent protein translocase protein TatC
MSGESDKEHLAEGTLISHLLELRDRLDRALIAVAICAAPCLYFQNAIYDFVADPIVARLPVGSSIISTGVVAPFMAPFKLALMVALLIAIPYVLWQIWGFVAPGLYRHEKKFAIPLVVSSVILFYIGVAFAYEFVFPVIFQYFIDNAPKTTKVMPDITQYLDFVITMSLCFGIAFEVPVAVVLLVITGIISVEKLARARGYVLIGIFVVAAILTPPDAVSQSIMAIPMYLLYEGGMFMARILMKMRLEQQKQEEAGGSQRP